MTPSLAKLGITLNITAPPPEPTSRMGDGKPCDLNAAIELAMQCRKDYPEDRFVLVPVGDLFTVVRVVV